MTSAETGNQTVDDAVRKEALSQYFDGDVKCTPTTGGVNNVCNYVETADGRRLCSVNPLNSRFT